MYLASTLVVAALAALGVHGSPVTNVERRATPTLYLAGDSTMAKLSTPTDGWGQYISKYVTLPVVNKAIAGRSARSFTVEGRFTEIEKLVTTGDIVVIEFGHNDGGSPNSATENGRSDCPGFAGETCKSGKTGETVYTFGYYVEGAAKSFIAKGASVIISSQTPNNVWETGTYSSAPSRFVDYATRSAKKVGTGASFVDHFQAAANMYKKLGAAKTNSLFPKDHTHTSPEGADLVAQAFAQAVSVGLNGTTPLEQYLKTGLPVVW
ncbi:SGNH hydrolase-type esterase domain-containing protein [Bombardia bombarda]|uniref:SGNH hydrolase-type esterase domain-containing protein n=1 Tax=Bombardia bombarda TaxID=252184 RepID=A0AA39TZC6_9PEZI|nr:SGNH hydrolase-type esterase domain-containing protein [Bombardia bombarda]